MGNTKRALGRVVAGVVLGVLLAGGAGGGVAWADETHDRSHNGFAVTLLKTGQIDDPLEDVLEHASILGGSNSTQE